VLRKKKARLSLNIWLRPSQLFCFYFSSDLTGRNSPCLVHTIALPHHFFLPLAVGSCDAACEAESFFLLNRISYICKDYQASRNKPIHLHHNHLRFTTRPARRTRHPYPHYYTHLIAVALYLSSWSGACQQFYYLSLFRTIVVRHRLHGALSVDHIRTTRPFSNV